MTILFFIITNCANRKHCMLRYTASFLGRAVQKTPDKTCLWHKLRIEQNFTLNKKLEIQDDN